MINTSCLLFAVYYNAVSYVSDMVGIIRPTSLVTWLAEDVTSSESALGMLFNMASVQNRIKHGYDWHVIVWL